MRRRSSPGVRRRRGPPACGGACVVAEARRPRSEQSARPIMPAATRRRSNSEQDARAGAPTLKLYGLRGSRPSGCQSRPRPSTSGGRPYLGDRRPAGHRSLGCQAAAANGAGDDHLRARRRQGAARGAERHTPTLLGRRRDVSEYIDGELDSRPAGGARASHRVVPHLSPLTPRSLASRRRSAACGTLTPSSRPTWSKRSSCTRRERETPGQRPARGGTAPTRRPHPASGLTRQAAVEANRG